MIAIVDYGMGNLRSVQKGFQKIGLSVITTSSAEVIREAKGIVLPGVGAFRDCISNLNKLNLIEVIIKAIIEGKPYLGICLGLQILFSESEEFGSCKGLDILKGKVVKFQKINLKIPHMGWNIVNIKKESPLFDSVPDKSYFYFVHSYYVIPEDKDIISATTEYGIEFTSAIWKNNIMATQFHPEKSQKLGLKILKNFVNFVYET